MNNSDLSLRVTSLTLAADAMNNTSTSADFSVTELAQWIYEWLKDAEAIDNPKKKETTLHSIN